MAGLFFDEAAGPLLIGLPPVVCTLIISARLGGSWRGAALSGGVAAVLATVVYIVLLKVLNPAPEADQGLAPVGALLAFMVYLPACLALALVLRALFRRR